MSLIPKFLTAAGREEVANADVQRHELEELHEKNGILQGWQQERLNKVTGVTRRDFFEKLGVGTVGFFAIVMAKSYISNRSPEKEAASKEEEKLDQRIAQIEAGFLGLENTLREAVKINGGLPDGITAERLYGPFEIMKKNGDNKSKNYLTFQRNRRNETDKQESNSEQILRERATYFYYDKWDRLDERLTGMLSFLTPVERKLYLRDDVDPQNLADLLLIYHDMSHAAEEERYLLSSEVKPPEKRKYNEVFKIKPEQGININIFSEFDAYASTLEVADIFMKGTLRDNTASLDDMLRTFEPKTLEREQGIKMLHVLASLYFPQGNRNGQYDRRFTEFLTRSYEKRGFKLYLIPPVRNKK